MLRFHFGRRFLTHSHMFDNPCPHLTDFVRSLEAAAAVDKAVEKQKAVARTGRVSFLLP